ncbi:hypothetical protein CXU06_04725 [Akkermansia muciniphila]|nr:hypothetical protein CUB89_11090 [Akkermansia muciniphila]MBE5696387.1 hypothetical protein [Akkermansia sp.]PNC42987.1 hypothetical protein CXU08_08545 [Akkermansia muciniphila]PNC54114.1 hypothetical protein CXU06_04725 [Akkermansia muciniphila]PNC78133.1 hypothetical protein CXU02_00780 [Akkermansia muciniphila]
MPFDTGRFSTKAQKRAGVSQGAAKMKNGKRYRPFFQIPFPLRKRNCWERPDHLPFFRKRTDAVFTQIPYGRKTASFFCPNHRRIPRRRIAACVFY